MRVERHSAYECADKTNRIQSTAQNEEAPMPNKSAPPKIVKLSRAKQRRLNELLERNSEGTITAREKAKLERLVAEAERLMVANAKRLAQFAKRQRPRAEAVPVTVWLQPAPAER